MMFKSKIDHLGLVLILFGLLGFAEICDSSNPLPSPILSVEELEQANSLMLTLINEARTDAGLNEVVLGDNAASQLHAEDMRENCFSSHWSSNGLKPYMRYTRAGGVQYEAENVSGSDYCPPDPQTYIKKSLDEEIRETMDGLMQSPGHRDNILDPYHRKVNLGFAYKRPNLWVVQQFEGDYIDFIELPAINNQRLNFSAVVKNGVTVKDETSGVQIYYDPTPQNLTQGQLQRTYCYSNVNLLTALREPLPESSYYLEDDLLETDHSCVNPYEIEPGVVPAQSYEMAKMLHDEAVRKSTSFTQFYKAKWITAEHWITSQDKITVSADLGSILQNRDSGVFTITVWGEIGGNSTLISQYSIFLPAS